MLRISNGVSKVAMLTIPFFVLAGAIMAEGGIARRLVAFADVLVGFTRMRGGLTQMPAKITAFFLSISTDKYVILLLINVLLLLLGCLVDMAPSILIST
ncbi:MAG TPA: TRAP transporter large permease subunit, partial [Xanthobacteraceae bacterium]